MPRSIELADDLERHTVAAHRDYLAALITALERLL
jgi:hypothetical protein